MQALIDADILTYRIGFACQKTRYFITDIDGKVIDLGVKKKKAIETAKAVGFSIEGMTSQLEVEPIENCLHSVKVAIEAIIAETKADSYRLFLTGKGNFREELVDYYKMNRKDAAKPHYYEDIRNYMLKHWNAEMQEGQEADDALSIAQMPIWNNTIDKTSCITTIDKDLKNTPGWNYNFVKKEMTFIDQEQADLNFYAQLITGDMTDNIPGLFQITGQKAFAKFFEPLAYGESIEYMWEYVVELYTDIFFQMDKTYCPYHEIQEAVAAKLWETGQLLWMRRTENETWEPPK